MLSRKIVQPVDPVLTATLIDYINEEAKFIADKIFPIIPVSTESGTYFTHTSSKGAFTLVSNTLRAPGAHYSRGTLTVGTDTFVTAEDGHEIPVDKRIQATAISPLDPYRLAVKRAGQVVGLRREYTVLSAITNATTFASYTAAVAAADRFDDPNSDPIVYMDGIADTIRLACGKKPNTGVIANNVWIKVKNHPVILDVLKVTQDKIITEDILAKIFNLARLLVSEAMYNSAQEGQTVSLADIMSKKIFLGYVDNGQSIESPSVGYCLQKSGFEAQSYFEVQSDSDVARARVNEVHKIVAADCGYLLTTVVS